MFVFFEYSAPLAALCQPEVASPPFVLLHEMHLWVDSHVGTAGDSTLDAFPGTHYLHSELKFHMDSSGTQVQ